ncbi:MAG: HYR domain-containing protein, partial [Flavobacteriales bacterium]|nr:HYR domain-containing protein [Flavobacteriales bacterium]
STFPIGLTTVTYLVTDASGNTASCSFTVTVNDTQLPVISCPANINVSNNPGICGAVVNYATPVGTDNCPGSVTSMTAGLASGSTFPIGSTLVTYLVTDASGNTASCSFTVTVNDTEAPSAICINSNAYLDATGNVIVAASSVSASTDNCSIISQLVAPNSFNCGDIGSNNVTLTVTDAAGLTASCMSTVTVIDNIDPTVTCQNVTVNMGTGGTASVTVGALVIGGADNCGSGSLNYTAFPTTFTTIGPHNVLITVTDGSGNEGYCTSIVTVIDLIPPVAICQPVTVYLNGAGSATISANALNGGSSDNSGVVNLLATQTSFNCTHLGNNNVFLLVTDGSGNSAFCMSVVTVVDTIAPVVTCQDIGVSLNASGLATITPAMVGAGSSDNCTIGLNYSLSQSTFTASGTYTVTLTVTDASGNSGTCSATVTVVDDLPPVALCQPVTIYLNASGGASITPNMIDAGSFDASGPVLLSVSQSAFNCTHTGTNVVTLIVTDSGGNNTLCTAVVTVLDTITPTAVCQNITVGLNSSGIATITGPMIGSSSTDNCTGWTYALSQSSFSAVGTYPVSLLVTDASGNTSSCTATVTVVDNLPPVALCQPTTIYLDATGSAGITPGMINAGSYDEAGPVTLAASQTGFSCSHVGTNNVTLIVTDGAGNSSLCIAVVTVLDTITPIAICQDITVPLNASSTVTITPAMVGGGSTDNCPGGLVQTLDQSTFTVSGPYTVLFTVTDASGNSSSCVSNVTVVDDAPPVALCQPLTLWLGPTGQVSMTPANIDAGSYDATGPVQLAASQTDFSCNHLGANNVTLIVTDVAGNNSFCLAVVTVLDTILPTAVCQDITVNLNALGVATITAPQLNGGSLDNCGSGSLSYSASQTSFTATGTYPVLLTVTDVSGNQTSCMAIVTVGDNDTPTAICQDLTLYLDANGTASLTGSDIDGGSFDNGSIAQILASQTQMDCSDLGIIPVVLTVIDDVGNQGTCTANVTVLDTISPLAVCQDITVYLDPNDMVFITAADVDGGTTDNCGNSPLILAVDETLFVAPGDYPVQFTVTDVSGNSSTCTATITVIRPQPEVVIPSGFSPNGDGIADTWVIKGIDYHQQNNLVIFNRWGNEIYRASPYRNEWSGQVNANMAMPGTLPTGTYFYQLDLGDGDVRTGYIQLNR